MPVIAALLALLILLLPASAQPTLQFRGMVATDDGSHLYFASQLLLRGQRADSVRYETRLYRVGADGVTLFADPGSLAPRRYLLNGGQVSEPYVSGDGTLVGFSFQNICQTDPDCSRPIPAEAQLRGRQNVDLGPGLLRLSRNGRWALLVSTPEFDFATRKLKPGTATLVDLSTGERTAVPPL